MNKTKNRTKFKVGEVIKFKGLDGNWKYERIFAIGNCPRHIGTNWIRVTDGGTLVNCGCLGDIKGGPYHLTRKERGL